MTTYDVTTEDDLRLTQRYGKDRVRVLKTIRTEPADATQAPWYTVHDLAFRVLLEGPHFHRAYTHGDNTTVIPTDTVKNILYALHATSPDVVWSGGLERVAAHVADVFLQAYPSLVGKVQVHVTDVGGWCRLPAVAADDRDTTATPAATATGTPPHLHPYAFQRAGEGSGERWTECIATQPLALDAAPGPAQKTFTWTSGLRRLSVLKATGSSFAGFHRCAFTTLQDATDRILCTDVTSSWTWAPRSFPCATRTVHRASDPVDWTVACHGDWPDYNAGYRVVRDTTLARFGRPTSQSVQATLYHTARRVLALLPDLQRVTYAMPNNHYFPAELQKLGFRAQGDAHGVYAPIQSPAGLIMATVSRKGLAKL